VRKRRSPSVRHLRLEGGGRELLRFLTVADPAVSPRAWAGRRPVDGDPGLEVVDISPAGATVPMFDITTGTGDFVAEGVVSHNCFARNTHTYLDLDAGADFDRQIVVKVNVARVLERELRAPRWQREPVAMGTNTDPYQRAEGRYRLMPAIVDALARSGTPFSVLTKGTVLSRDLPRLRAASRTSRSGWACRSLCWTGSCRLGSNRRAVARGPAAAGAPDHDAGCRAG
jgi:hypothetical protein